MLRKTGVFIQCGSGKDLLSGFDAYIVKWSIQRAALYSTGVCRKCRDILKDLRSIDLDELEDQLKEITLVSCVYRK